MSMLSNRLSRLVVSGGLAMLLLLASVGVFAGPVDINSADANTLAAELKGIGASRAEAIVAYRESNGPFRQVEDLLKVKGVGEKTLEMNRALLLIKTPQ